MSRARRSLPVGVLDVPHWRVNFRPTLYDPEALSSLAQCRQLVEQNQVRLRGWYYPHISNEPGSQGYGSNWVANWCDAIGHQEYWRFYQSKQFLHFFAVGEAANQDWRRHLEEQAKGHLAHYPGIDWKSVPGFLSILNVVYSVAEIVEFAARLSTAGVYEGSLTLDIALRHIRGFVLMTDWNRLLNNYYAASEDQVARTWAIDTADLLKDTTGFTFSALAWMFERFGWLDVSEKVIKRDIDDYRNGRG